MATDAQRHHIGHTIQWLQSVASHLDYPPHDNRDDRDSWSWHLSEGQAAYIVSGGGRLQMDCSEVGSWILKAAGLWHWSGPGYTGSHLQLLTQHYTDPRQAYTGALVIFGPGSGDHECMVYQPDHEHGDPLLAGHGRPGFDVARLSAIRARHRPPVTFLSIAHL